MIYGNREKLKANRDRVKEVLQVLSEKKMLCCAERKRREGISR